MSKIEETYPFVVNDIMKYIEEIKTNDRKANLLDIIMDYSLKFDVELELLGDAIAGDVYLKSFIEKDCRMAGVFGRNKETIGEW